ncbi:MAG TPA: PAS domain S-box protein [Methanoregula sp.]|nr:PAS domain S-box protein [Methanoregula sp.]
MITVLYVDDEPELLTLAKLFLEREGEFSVTTTTSSADVLQLLEEQPFDAIISDYQMPVMDGIELLKQVRGKNLSIPFILFTGNGREDVVIEAIDSGADFYLQKGGAARPQFAELSHKILTAVERRHSRDAQIVSERRFASVFYSSPIAKVICDVRTGRIIDINDTLLEYMGRTRSEVVGRTFTDLGFFTDPHLGHEIITSLMTGKPVKDREITARDPRGKKYTLLFSATLIREGENNLLISQVVDITGVTQARKVIDALLNASPEVSMLLDTYGEILAVNHAATVRFHASAEELIGSDAYSLLSSDLAELRLRNIGEVVRTGQPLIFTDDRTGHHYENHLSPVTDPEGVVTAVAVYSRDITEARNGHRELRDAYEKIAATGEELRSQYEELKTNQQTILESEEKYRTLVEHVMDGVFIAQENRIVFANRAFAALTGYPEQELLGKPITVLIAPEDREIVAFRHRSRLAGNSEPEIYEFSLLHQDNSTRIRVRMSVGAGNYRGMPATIGTVHDITEERKREERIRESEARSRQIADASDEGLIMHKNRIILDVNTSACALWGYVREDLIGGDVLDLVAPSSHDLVQEKIQNTSDGIYETELQRQDGSRFLGHIHSRNINYHNDVIRLTSVRDITQARKAEEALQKSEELHRKMIGTIPDIVVKADLQGTITFINERGALLAGEETASGVIGKSMFSFMAPECLELAQKNTIRMFEKPLGPVEYTFIGGGGRRIDLEVNGDVVRMPDGTPFGMVYICRDITERKLAERELRENEEKYRRIIEDMQDVYYRVDRQGTITMISPYGAKTVGYDSPEEMIGKMRADQFYADVRERDAFMAVLMKQGTVTNYPMTLVDRHGKWHYATASSRVMRDASGAFIGIEGILHDITDLRQAERSLKEANKKLNLLSDITRHDIRNKLTSLLGLLDLVRARNNDPKAQESLDQLIAIAEMVSEQIEFTRDYQELGILEPRWSDVHEMVRTAAAGVTLGKVRLSHDKDFVGIYADPLVEKVFYNLIDNAVRYGEKITRITVSAEVVPEGCRIVVEDDGIGIPASDMEKVFFRGFGNNTGFGLFLAREVLAITGITIRETGEYGIGARFEILVPEHAYRMKTRSTKTDRKMRPAT